MADPWRSYVASIEQLKTQWATGPLSGHRGCCRSSWGERTELPWRSTEIRKLWHQVSPNRWCKSISCRPGDPFGCSMTKARTYRDRTELIIDGWLSSDHAADLVLLEAAGEAGQPLDLVLSDAATGVRYALEGKYRTAGGVVGKIQSLAVVRGQEGEWTVRHWLVLGRRSVPEGGKRASERIIERFTRAVDGARGRTLSISRDPDTVRAVAQLVTGCRSDLDPDPGVASEIDRHFDLDGVQTVAQLAERYRGEAVILRAQFADLAKGYDIERAGDRFEIAPKSDGRRRWQTLLLPDEARPFVEYAVAMRDHPASWNAYPVKPRDAETERWNELVRRAQSIKASYMPYEVSSAGRSGRKK